MSMSPEQAPQLTCPPMTTTNVSLILDPRDALPLMGVFAAVGWAVGVIVSVLPGVSASTRAHAAAVRDHALIAAFLAGVAGAIGRAADWVLRDVIGGGLNVTTTSHWTAYDFFLHSAIISGLIIAAIGALSTVAVIPLIGPFLAFFAGVVLGPSTLILTTILVVSALQAATLLVALQAIPIVYPAGFALMAAPGRIAKGLGAFLISLSLVMYVMAPVIPFVMASIVSKSFAGESKVGSDPIQMLTRICETAKMQFNPQDVVWSLLNPFQYYKDLFAWLLTVLAGALLVALSIALARALSHSIGGVSASI